MSVVEIKEKMKTIQRALLEFLEDDSNAEENSENFFKFVNEYELTEDKYKFKSILRLINAIGNNHQRVQNFIFKLEQILGKMKQHIRKFFQIQKFSKYSKKTNESFYFLLKII